MAKPTRLINWISSGNAIVHPDLTARTAGFPPGGLVPNTWLNDNWTILTEWIDGYLNVLDLEAITWLARHRFDEGVRIGDGLVADIFDALTERVDMIIAPSSESARSLLLTIRLSAGGSAIRFYSVIGPSTAKGLDITFNAVWTGTWAKDANGEEALLFRLSQNPGSLIAARKPEGEDTAWADTFNTSGGWHDLIASFSGAGFAATIKGPLTVDSLIVPGTSALNGAVAATAGLAVTGGPFSAATGADRAEHRAYLADYTGGGGTTSLQFSADAGLAVQTRNRMWLGNGAVTRLVVWLGFATSADVTVEVFKVDFSAVTTVLGSVTIPAGLVHNQALFVTGNGYIFTDYLGLRISTAGAAALASVDVGATIRTAE